MSDEQRLHELYEKVSAAVPAGTFIVRHRKCKCIVRGTAENWTINPEGLYLRFPTWNDASNFCLRQGEAEAQYPKAKHIEYAIGTWRLPDCEYRPDVICPNGRWVSRWDNSDLTEAYHEYQALAEKLKNQLVSV